MKSLSILFFDGECGICHGAVQFLLKRDKKRKLTFSPLQGETAKKLISHEDREKMNTVIFCHQGESYQKSTAIIRAMSVMGRVWKLTIIALLIPPVMRDFTYDFIASRRKRWSKKNDFCFLPTKEYPEQFLP